MGHQEAADGMIDAHQPTQEERSSISVDGKQSPRHRFRLSDSPLKQVQG